MSVRLISDSDNSQTIEILLEEILGRIAEAVFVIDKQGRFLYVNRAAYEDRGYSKEEFLKLNVRDINLPERAKLVQARINEVKRNGQTTFETVHVRKDGSTFPVEITSRMIRAGEVAGMIAVARDISWRLKEEEQLKASEEKYRDLFEDSPLAIFKTTADGRIEMANSALARMLGYETSEELIAKVPNVDATYIDPSSRDKLYKIIGEQGTVRNFETALRRKDGSIFWGALNARAIRGNKGEIAGVEGQALDISDRKAAEIEIMEYQRLLEGILSSSDAPIFSIDNNGRYSSFNKAHADAIKLSYGADIEMGKKIFDYLSVKADKQNAMANFKRVLKGERFSEVTKYGDDKKSRLYFEMTYNPILDDEGKVVGASVYARNITERRRAEAALRESEERYRSVFENTTVGVIRTGADGSLLSSNPAFAQMLGYKTTEELINAVPNVRALYVDPGQRKRLLVILNDKVVANDYPIELKRKDGSVCSISVNVRAIKDKTGKVIALEGLLVDITQRRQAEEQLKEAHGKLEATLRAIPDLMFEVDTKGQIYDYHAPANELLYAPPETFVGKNVSKVLPEPAAYICMEAISKATAHGWSRGATYMLDLPKAGKRWFELSIDTKKHDSKKIERLLVISRDITDRVLAEESIKHERDTAQMYLDIVDTVVVAVNAEGNVIMINKYGADLLGYTEEEIIGKPWLTTFIPYHERALVEGMFERIAKGEKAVESYDNTVLRKNGEERLINWRHRFVNDDKGKLKFVVSSGVDITDIHKARYEVRQSYSQLQSIVDGIIKALAMTVETRDPYTAGHQRRVAQLAVAMAEVLGWKEIQIKGLEMAATIHDIGKMYVPAEILNKPGKLDAVEFELIKLHSAAGYNIVKDIEFVEPVADMVRQHHERLDGSGYPDGLKHQDIVPGAKVMAVADVVEAMSSDRPYRPGRGLNAALEEVQDRKGGLYDAEAVEACMELFVKAKFKFD
ncbi:MAG: PAS domain S-box protein [Actinomycetota bacterium]